MIVLRCWFLLLSVLCPLLLSAQLPGDSLQTDSVGYIYVEGQEDETAETLSLAGRNDFYRNMVLWRLPMQHPQNDPLRKAANPDVQAAGLSVYAQVGTGLTFHLLEGLRTGRIRALHPQDLRRRYDYFDLVYDLIGLEGLNPDALYEGLRAENLGWEYLNAYLDLVVEEGFSSQNGRPFMRIRYLRMLWYNPESPRGIHVLAVIPYAEAQAVVAELQSPLPQTGGKDMRLRLEDFLQFHMFRGFQLPPDEDPAQNLPPNRRSPEALRNRWPELWEKH